MTPNSETRPHSCLTEDGLVLRGWIWDPHEIRGVVVIRTPYGAWRHTETALAWNQRGYRCIVQDVRGRHASEGSWHPYSTERSDGRATVEAIAAENPELPLILSGGSYAAHTALEAARTRRADALVLLVPALGLAETAWSEDGDAQLWHRIGWWHQHGRGSRSFPALSNAELTERVAQTLAIGVHAAAKTWGWSPQVLLQWRRLWSATRLDLPHEYGSLTQPLLLVRGDHDFFHADANRLASAWQGPLHVVDGPWGHRLGADITDVAIRDALRKAGGIGGVLDAWLAMRGLPAPDSSDTRVDLIDAARSRSVFDHSLGNWHYERTP